MWGGDGREIFYVTPGGKLVAVELKTSVSGLEAGTPKELFDFSRGTGYTVSADGQRFLVALQAEDPSTSPLTVVLNWTADLKR